MKKKLLLNIVFTTFIHFAFPQSPDKKKVKAIDTTEISNITHYPIKKSPVRTISDQQYNAYLRGYDLNNMAYVAELNHYPQPDLLLSYKKELDLSPIQIAGINGVLRMLQIKKMEVGGSIIRNERTLDSLFRMGKIDEGTIIFFGNRYGLYEGEYRTSVLQACYKIQKLLTDGQIKKFESLQKHN